MRHHTIDYIEFVVRDMALSKCFFAEAFGWSFTDYGPSYAGIQGPDREQGGLTVGEPQPGGPLVVLYSADVEATLAAVQAAGGTVTKPPFDFPGGRRFEFTDPNGYAFAAWGEAPR